VAAGLERRPQPPQVLLACVDVMIDVHQQHQVDLVGQARVVGLCGDGDQVLAPFALRALGQVPDHVGLDVDRVDAPARQHARQSDGEVAGAGAISATTASGLSESASMTSCGFCQASRAGSSNTCAHFSASRKPCSCVAGD